MAPRYDEAPETVPPAFPEYHPPPTGPEVTPSNQGYMQYPSSPIFKREDSTYPNYGYPMSSVGPPSSHNYGNNTAGYGSLRTDPSDVGGATERWDQDPGVLGVGLRSGGHHRNPVCRRHWAGRRHGRGGKSGEYGRDDSGCPPRQHEQCSFYFIGNYGKVLRRADPRLLDEFVRSFGDDLYYPIYTKYTPGNFANTTANGNKTCSGVSFVPGWTDRKTALEGQAPGNCYLKPGPQNKTGLQVPNNGQETHSAFRLDD
ncbi:hypothetical protein PG999_008871 [Apiospora kogelbergensis]|uniref:Uncharacterized protein n=1 Tax=Apiospora kogelbergensis TaxID=1337665 RepID=A0AAW0QHN6_9PEZI